MPNKPEATNCDIKTKTTFHHGLYHKLVSQPSFLAKEERVFFRSLGVFFCYRTKRVIPVGFAWLRDVCRRNPTDKGIVRLIGRRSGMDETISHYLNKSIYSLNTKMRLRLYPVISVRIFKRIKSSIILCAVVIWTSNAFATSLLSATGCV
jgi:hypothetical protein